MTTITFDAIRQGRYQDVLRDVGDEVTVITDPPYSARTHDGHNGASRRDPSTMRDPNKISRPVTYSAWGPADVAEFVDRWGGISGWMVVMTDYTLAPIWEREMAAVGRYVFAPIAYVAPGSRIRLTGDGPSNWTVWVVVSRPRTAEAARWGTLPGAYVLPSGYSERLDVVGGKPLWIMRALVRDYSRRGDLIVDPCAGAGTTLLAALIERRMAIGAEMDAERCELARQRTRRGWTPTLEWV